MAGLGYKDFTAGAVLTAAQVDGYLMEQSVMNFAGTAARGSALSSVQSAGMMAHVGGGTVTVYDGSAWQQIYPTSPGLVYVAGTAFSAASAVNVNNCFTSTYDNYSMLVDFSAASTALTVSMRLRAAGADNSTNNYTRQNYSVQQNVGTGTQTLNATSWGIATSDATYLPYYRFAMNIFAPQMIRTTVAALNSFYVSITPNYFVNLDSYLFNATTSFDGFSLLTSTGTVSGVVRIYGYRNS